LKSGLRKPTSRLLWQSAERREGGERERKSMIRDSVNYRIVDRRMVREGRKSDPVPDNWDGMSFCVERSRSAFLTGRSGKSDRSDGPHIGDQLTFQEGISLSLR
jgi:hypothetical protein